MTDSNFPTNVSTLTPIFFTSPHLHSKAADLAERWNFFLCDDQSAIETESLYLLLSDEHLALLQNGPDAPGPIYVDFAGGAVSHRRKFGGGKGQPIAKAAGYGKGASPSVLDATAGLGRDAFVFASLGSEVWLVERSPVVAALLEDGLQRALLDEETSPVVSRMHLCMGDAKELLTDWSEQQRPDIVYLDPMYPPRQKSALVKKEMRLFQQLIGEDGDADSLLPEALKIARQRVVVKRPDYAPWLNGTKPTLVFETKKNRFDVYVIKALTMSGSD